MGIENVDALKPFPDGTYEVALVKEEGGSRMGSATVFIQHGNPPVVTSVDSEGLKNLGIDLTFSGNAVIAKKG